MSDRYITTGNPIRGVAVNPNKFQCVMTLDQAEQFGLVEPHAAQSVGKAAVDPSLRKSHAMRELVQRRFDAARLRRADDYARYLVNIDKEVSDGGRYGGTPAITLFCADQGIEADGVLILDYGSTLVAIDGETQTQAWFNARKTDPDMGRKNIAFTLYHGIPIDHAKQILRDYNSLANPVSEKVMASFNVEGPLTTAIAEAMRAAGVSAENINRHGDKGTRKFMVSHAQLMAFAAGFIYASDGMMRKISPAQLKSLNTAGAVNPASQDATVSALMQVMKAVKANPSLGKMPALIWQTAGAAMGEGRPLAVLNWTAAAATYAATQSGGRGGARIGVNDRIVRIATALTARAAA